MIEFYATVIFENQEELKDFKIDVMKNNMHIRVETPDNGEQHFAIQGDWNGYRYLLGLSAKQGNDKEKGKYHISSLEHFED